jgi:predicted GNAT family acetyltransferase
MVRTKGSLAFTRFPSASEFQLRAEPFLLHHEAVHCLPIGICSNLIQAGQDIGDVYLATGEQDGAIVAAAVMTPPWPLVLSLATPESLAAEALSAIAEDLYARSGQISGVNGPVPLSRQFAEVWSGLTGQSFHLGIRERIYQLEQVQPVSGVPGRLRAAVKTDGDLLVRWLEAFEREALGDNEHVDAPVWVEDAFSSPSRGVYLWENREPVAFVAHGGPTPHGMRIGPVYTPPEHRRHGYASAATAAVSQLLLDSGRDFCFLYTDLGNPTSNHIYQEIGYRPVCDVEIYRF